MTFGYIMVESQDMEGEFTIHLVFRTCCELPQFLALVMDHQLVGYVVHVLQSSLKVFVD